MKTSGYIRVASMLFGTLLAISSPAAAASVRSGDRVGVQWSQTPNGNWRALCRQGQSFVNVAYNHGEYDVIVRLRQQPSGAFDTWDDLVSAPDLWTSGRLSGLGSPGREGYFHPVGRSARTGTVGVELLDPGTGDQVWSTMRDFSLQCGIDYAIWLTV